MSDGDAVGDVTDDVGSVQAIEINLVVNVFLNNIVLRIVRG
jgi:hypothetical protein